MLNLGDNEIKLGNGLGSCEIESALITVLRLEAYQHCCNSNSQCDFKQKQK